MAELPTKKQRALLDFIASFIGEYGYSPSYREIRAGLSYGSIATVAKHIDNLVTKGLLIKRQKSARSLDLASGKTEIPAGLLPKTSSQEKWLIDAIDTKFRIVEQGRTTQADIDQLTVLVASLKVLSLDGAFTAFNARLKALQKK